MVCYAIVYSIYAGAAAVPAALPQAGSGVAEQQVQQVGRERRLIITMMIIIMIMIMMMII